MKKSKSAKSIFPKIQALIDFWAPRLYLSDWRFDIQEAPQDINEVPEGVMLSVLPDARYLNAHIQVYPIIFEISPKQLEEAVVHELLHCVQAEMMSLIEEARTGQIITNQQLVNVTERLTQRLSRIVLSDRK